MGSERLVDGVVLSNDVGFHDIIGPASALDFTTQPKNVTIQQGVTGGSQVATFAAGGLTLSTLGVTSPWDDYTNGNWQGIHANIPAGCPNFRVDALIDSPVNWQIGGATQVSLMFHRPGGEKPVSAARMGIIYEYNGGHSVFKSEAAHNGTHATHGGVVPANPSVSLKLAIEVRGGREYKAWYAINGGADVEIDAGYRTPTQTILSPGIVSGMVSVGLGNSNGNALAISCRLVSLAVSGRSFA